MVLRTCATSPISSSSPARNGSLRAAIARWPTNASEPPSRTATTTTSKGLTSGPSPPVSKSNRPPPTSAPPPEKGAAVGPPPAGVEEQQAPRDQRPDPCQPEEAEGRQVNLGDDQT